MSADAVEYGPRPEGRAVGASAVAGRRVRVMIALPEVMYQERVPIAYHEVSIADAVQFVQALRQAIGDARKGRVR